MIIDQYGQQIYSEEDLFDQLMEGKRLSSGLTYLVVDEVSTAPIRWMVDELPRIEQYVEQWSTPEEFDRRNQQTWLMPDQYKELDVARYVLDRCQTQAELQRAGEELLMYADRNMLDLLRYLVYLVDTMRANRIVWGVGRGSSVASFVLYLIGIHRVNSLHYDLDIGEFLR